jgi:hypothetical protein
VSVPRAARPTQTHSTWASDSVLCEAGGHRIRQFQGLFEPALCIVDGPLRRAKGRHL